MFYGATGAPLEAWHKTGGWTTTAVIFKWLRKIAKTVLDFDKDMVIVLVMDCVSTHLNEKVLQECRRLKIRVLMIPAKTTWILQPLDVYVFACLKRAMRVSLAKEEMKTPHGHVSLESRIKVVGQAIQQELVSRTWSPKLSRLGLTQGDPGNLRDDLQRLTVGLDMTPRPPSKSELAEVLTKNAALPRVNWEHLLLSDYPEAVSSSVVKLEPLEAQGVKTETSRAESASLPPGQAAASSSSSSAAAPAPAHPVQEHSQENTVRASRLPSAPLARRLSVSQFSNQALNEDIVEELPPRSGPSAGTRAYSKGAVEAKP